MCGDAKFERKGAVHRVDKPGGLTFYSACATCGALHYRLDDGEREGFMGDLAAAKLAWTTKQQAPARTGSEQSEMAKGLPIEPPPAREGERILDRGAPSGCRIALDAMYEFCGKAAVPCREHNQAVLVDREFGEPTWVCIVGAGNTREAQEAKARA